MLGRHYKLRKRSNPGMSQLSLAPPCSKHQSSFIAVTSLNDDRPVVLTSVGMKVLVLTISYFLFSNRDRMDLLQFAYQVSRSVDDAVFLALDFVLHHLDYPGSYTHLLGVEYNENNFYIFLTNLIFRFKYSSDWICLLDCYLSTKWRPSLQHLSREMSLAHKYLLILTSRLYTASLPHFVFPLTPWDD